MEVDNDSAVVSAVTAIHIIHIIIDELIDDDEDENHETLQKSSIFAEFTVPSFSDHQFRTFFKMLPETFETLLVALHNLDMQYEIQLGRPELPLEKQLMVTVWYLANLESFKSVANRFGICTGSCWNILYRICKRLVELNRRNKIIAFPDRYNALKVMKGFRQYNGFPGIIGCIDGCHIQIQKPVDFPNSYINRKGFASVVLQAVCDHRNRLLDAYVGQPGSMHDARVFSKSDLCDRIRNGDIDFPYDAHLIGDAAYPLSKKLLVPFKRNRRLTEVQKLFNCKLAQNRALIEHTFGLLKQRFRRLRMIEARRLDIVCLLVITACILHNVCIQKNDFYDRSMEEMDSEDQENNDHGEENIRDGIDENYGDDEEVTAVMKRQNIANELYDLYYE